MTKVASTPSSVDLAGTASTAAFPSPAPVTEGFKAVEKIADFRLVIEEDPATGSFVYKTLDRRTGEIVNQFPREQVLRLKDAEHYAPGIVFNSQS
jgi:flagellar protein FlaG